MGGKNFGKGIWWDSRVNKMTAVFRIRETHNNSLVLGGATHRFRSGGTPHPSPPLGEPQHARADARRNERASSVRNDTCIGYRTRALRGCRIVRRYGI
nr:MAG TPA: hypothetical protein [Caudoviricetes sp.]